MDILKVDHLDPSRQKKAIRNLEITGKFKKHIFN